jgi:hypothetical protein
VLAGINHKVRPTVDAHDWVASVIQ